MIALQQRAEVYIPAANGTGDFTHLVKSALPCRITVVPVATLAADVRAEDIPRNRLLWHAGYTMPSPAQVQIGADRWTVRAGSEDAIKGPFGSTVYWRADVSQVVT